MMRRLLGFALLFAAFGAHAQDAGLQDGPVESAPIIFQRETVRILPTAPEKPQPPQANGAPAPAPAARFPATYSVEIRDERALGLDYIHALNQLSPTTGVLIFFTSPTVAPLPRFQIHEPLDVLFIDEQGVISEILPNHVPGESAQDFMSQEPAKAWIYLMAGQVAARDIRPHDTVQGSLFLAAPTVLR